MKHESIEVLAVKHGMVLLENYSFMAEGELYPVMIDGRHAGYVDQKLAKGLDDAMRRYKVEG